MMLIRIDTQVQWQIARDPQSDRWVGVCSPLGITAEAETWEKLAGVIGEEINELLLDLFQEGELQKFLEDRGWHPLMALPVGMPREGVKFDVPMELRLAPVATLTGKNAHHAEA